MHKRRKFVEDLKTQLKAINYFSGVWIQRIPIARAQYPSVTLYADNETTETLIVHNQPRDQERVITVFIVAWIRGTPDDERPEEQMDNAAEQIEQNLVIPIGACDMVLVNTDFTIDDEEPELHQVTLTYEITYNSIENNPSI